MSTDTKFRYGDRVMITKGFYRGYSGVCELLYSRSVPLEGAFITYKVSIPELSESIWVQESDLELEDTYFNPRGV